MAQPRKTSCLDYATNYLYRYPKTHKEMITQLMKKWYNSEEIEDTMQALKSKHYIDDRQFAELYLNSEVVSKGKPLAVMRQKLIFKWVDKHLLDTVIAELETEIKEWTMTRILKEVEKFRTKDLEPVVIIQKLLARGYKFEDIKHALKNKNSD